MTTPLQIRSVADTIYDYMLSSSYRNQWAYNQAYALSKDPDIFEVTMRDASFASSIDRFQNSVVRPFRVEAPKGTKNTQSKQASRITEQALRKSMLFDDMRKRLSLSRLQGRSYEYVNWSPVLCSLADHPPMEWVIPVSFENIDSRRIRWVPSWNGEDGIFSGGGPGNVLTTKRFIFSVARNAWLEMSDEFKDALIEDIYPVEESRLGYGRGCLDQFYIYAYYKAIFLEKLSQGVDRWANGMLVGKIDSTRLASLPKTSASVQSAMATVLQTARSEHVIVLDKADEIEVINGGMEGHQMCMEGIKYVDECVERLLNGSIRGSGHGQQNGARAAAETESDSSEAFYQAYRQHQDQIITRDVLGYFWNHPTNRMNFLKLGLGTAEMGAFTSEQIKKQSVLESIQIVTAARQAGIPLLKSEVYEKLEFTQPEPMDDTFDGAMAMPDGGMEMDSTVSPLGLSNKDSKSNKQEDRDHEVKMAESKGKDDGQDGKFQALENELRSMKDLFLLAASNRPMPPANVHLTMPKLDQPVIHFEAQAAPMPNVVVNIPKQDAPVVNVAAPNVTVNVPKQTAPIVNVAQPSITVTSPTVNVAAPNVTNNVPAQAAPIVNVNAGKSEGKQRIVSLKRDELGRLIEAQVDVRG